MLTHKLFTPSMLTGVVTLEPFRMDVPCGSTVRCRAIRTHGGGDARLPLGGLGKKNFG